MAVVGCSPLSTPSRSEVVIARRRELPPDSLDPQGVGPGDVRALDAALAMLVSSASPACIVWRDEAGQPRVVAHNARFAESCAARSLRGQALFASLPELEPAWGAAVTSALAGSGATSEARPVPLAESLRIARAAATWLPLPDARGRPRGALALFHDVSPVVEDMRRLLGTVAHDLSDPVLALQFTARQLSRDVPGVDAEARRVTALADRMAQMIGDLGAFARIATGEAPRLSRGAANLATIVEDACDELAPRSAPMFVSCREVHGLFDAAAIVRVVANLVGNARRHGPPGGTVRVSTALVDGCARIEVSDEGQGFDPADAPRLFEPWRRASSAPGSGLGLYIVRSLVHAHGGTVAAERLTPGGFVVRVSLPLGGSGTLPRTTRAT
jgi:signal transduction histidine kinase